MKESNFKTEYKEKNKYLQIIKQGVLNLQICTNFEEHRIKDIVDRIYPCGTTSGWSLSKRSEVAPVKCKEKEGFIHYLMDC